jgi:hypothetical protein
MCRGSSVTRQSRFRAEDVPGTGCTTGRELTATGPATGRDPARSRRDRNHRAGPTVEGDEEREASEARALCVQAFISAASMPARAGRSVVARADRRSNLRAPSRRRAPCGTPAEARAAALRGGSVRILGRCVYVLRRSALRCADPRAARVFDLPCFTPGVSRRRTSHARALVHRPASRIAARRSAGGRSSELAGEDDPALFGTADVTFTLPARAAEILSAPEPRAPLDSPCTAWLTAVRRWSRRHARMGLTALIRRPGRVHISRTHIAAGFALSQIDVRLRRLALDVDPGWVPWMGRVVQFNYGERHDRA